MATLNQSWLAGKYRNGEINIHIPYVAVDYPEFYAQGDEAQEIIDQLSKIWDKNEHLSAEQVFDLWVFFNLS